MDELQELFGDGSLNYEEFSQKLTASGKKLVDLSGGGYVAKSKYDRLNSEYTTYKTENDVSKYADYDSIKAELETLKAEKAEAETLKEVAAGGVADKFQKFVASEVKALVTDKKDFKSCLKDYLAENPQFLTNTQSQSVFRFGSQLPLEKGSGATEKKTTNQKMNEMIRSIRK